jgi:hypothetical protein
MAQLESSLRAQNGLVKKNPEAHPPAELYIARTLVQNCCEISMRVLNATCLDQKLTKRYPLAHCEPVTLVIPPDVELPQVRDTTLKLQDVIAATKPNLSGAESRELEELLTAYGEILSIKSDDYGWTDSVPPYRYGRGPTDPPAP